MKVQESNVECVSVHWTPVGATGQAGAVYQTLLVVVSHLRCSGHTEVTLIVDAKCAALK